MRTIVDLRPDQIKRLGQLCEQTKISRAEAVRRGVDLVIEQEGKPARESAFGLWKHKRFNARQRVERLRAEWNRR